MHPFTELSYNELQPLRKSLLAPAGASRPAVSLLEREDGKAVLKDYHVCSVWFRRLIAPILVWREVKGMRRLAGLRGVPLVIQQLDRLAFVMEYLPADRLARKRKAQWPNPDWLRLEELIAEMHARGVAHCDLRRSSNILFNVEGEPFLVDFAGHVQRGASWNIPWNWAFERFMRADRTAVYKLKQRVAPELLSAEEKALLAHRSGLDHAARGLGIWLRKLGRFLTGSDGSA